MCSINNKFKNSAFVSHISFLWHLKNFFFLLRYPFMKVRNVWTGKFLGYKYTMYDEIPVGWRKAFGKDLLRDIKKAGKTSRKRLHKHLSWREMLYWEQIKEKYGELCLYASATEEIRYVLDKYEILSSFYCINCGKKAKYCTKGWIEYLCEDCFNDYLDTLKENIDRLKEKNGCRLLKSDIPHITKYENNQEYEVDLKKEYGIDIEELVGDRDE